MENTFDRVQPGCRITATFTRPFLGEWSIKVLLDSYNPSGSTRLVRFSTTKTDR